VSGIDDIIVGVALVCGVFEASHDVPVSAVLISGGVIEGRRKRIGKAPAD
jgi:hypothetical protein